MASRRQLRRQFQIEGLERRDTPSALTGSVAEIHMEKTKKPPPPPKYKFTAVPISMGTGALTLAPGTLTDTSASLLTSGSITVPKKNAFHASFGAFSGNISVNQVGSGQYTGVGQFNLKGGALILSFNLSGSLTTGFNGSFTVVAGSGKFAHTTGTGMVAASVNLQTQTGSLILTGKFEVGVQVKAK